MINVNSLTIKKLIYLTPPPVINLITDGESFSFFGYNPYKFFGYLPKH